MKSRTGDRQADAAPPGEAEDPLVCYCMKIPESSLREAIAAGASNLQKLMDFTRAGTGCGTCRVDLLTLIRQSEGREND